MGVLRNVGLPRSLIFSVVPIFHVGFGQETSGIVYSTKCFDYWNRRKNWAVLQNVVVLKINGDC